MILRFLLLPLCLALAACTGSTFDVGTPPELSPVGSGLSSPVSGTTGSLGANPAFAQADDGWAGSPADYFRDQRARRTGDLITVKIAIDDEASLKNTSNLSRQAQADAGIETSGSIFGYKVPAAAADGTANSSSSSSGQGSTVRSEKIDLAVAAIVTSVLPNGYLVIDGSQEVMVNDEQRILHVAGIVHPGDISPDNRVSYEKIAEARISYGGKGRIANAQKPSLTQRLWSSVNPF